MQPDICNLVNRGIYNNRLQNDNSIANQTRYSNWDMFLISWLSVSQLSDKMSPILQFLSVNNREDMRDQISCL